MQSSPARPVRVAVVCHTGTLGGAEVALCRLLAAVDRTRFDPIVILFADGPLGSRLREQGIEVRVLELEAKVAGAERHSLGRWSSVRSVPATAWFVIRLARLLRRIDPDVVHTNSLKADLIATPAARLARRPVVWYLHDRISADYLPGWLARVVRTLARRAPGAVLANSRATLSTVAPLPASRAAVAYPGLPLTEPVLAHMPADPPRIGIIGRISPTKGQQVFLRAAAIVHRQWPEVQFVVVGAALFNEQAYETDTHRLAEELGLGAVVRFTGQVSDPGVELTDLSACVHASPVPEPFGQVILEAMAAGVPVIATRGGGVGEITGSSDQFALTVPPGDVAALASAMLAVLADPAAAAARAERAGQRVRERFDIALTAHIVQDTWQRAARRRPNRATD